jgi:prepilin-type processing-associated H-X9-DG protein
MKPSKRLSWSRGSSATGLSLADLLVVVVLIPLMGVAFLGCWRRTCRTPANRVKCSSNLRQIGQAILLYSNENGGAYPRTRFEPGPIVIPTWGTGASAQEPSDPDGPKPNDVSAALFLLLRTQEITTEVFTCPSSNAEKWDLGGGSNTALNWSNWAGRDGIRKHLSYSYQNPYPDDDAVVRKFVLNNSVSAEFAVAADINPGTEGDGQNVLAVGTTSATRDMKQANSRNHDGDGQNVLYGDGHVEFQSSPFCGVQRDNIYARRAGASGWASSDVRNSPYDGNDSVLLPTDD